MCPFHITLLLSSSPSCLCHGLHAQTPTSQTFISGKEGDRATQHHCHFWNKSQTQGRDTGPKAFLMLLCTSLYKGTGEGPCGGSSLPCTFWAQMWHFHTQADSCWLWASNFTVMPTTSFCSRNDRPAETWQTFGTKEQFWPGHEILKREGIQ